MSDAALLLPDAGTLEFAEGGRTWKVAAPDTDDELYFQARHEAMATRRIDAVRDEISAQAYETRLALLNRDTNANRFAFGGPLCLEYLWTAAGQAAYLFLLMDKGFRKFSGERPPPQAELARRLRDEDEALLLLWRDVLRRDFPRTAARVDALASQATAGPSPTTGGSSSPSVSGPATR